MQYQYPLRPEAHQLEEMSERFFQNQLPGNWTFEKPAHDYGIDIRVDLFNGNRATGLELLVQLKASREGSHGETEKVTLKTSTYNYLWDKLQVAILVKYIQNEDKAYWIFLSDVPGPNQEAESFTVHIPKTNSLCTIDWDRMFEYVHDVTDKKLAAHRKKELQHKKN